MVRLSMLKAEMPKESVAVMKLRYQNEDVKVAGGASVGNNSITCRDFIDRSVLKILKNWQRQVHSWETGETGYASEYKKRAIVRLLDPHGEVIRFVTADGVWPSSITYTPLNYEAETGQVQVNITLEVDRWLMEAL